MPVTLGILDDGEPPRPLIVTSPALPSLRLPVRTTPITLLPKARAAVRKRQSTAGRTRFSRGPPDRVQMGQGQNGMVIRGSGIDPARLDLHPVPGLDGEERSGPIENLGKEKRREGGDVDDDEQQGGKIGGKRLR